MQYGAVSRGSGGRDLGSDALGTANIPSCAIEYIPKLLVVLLAAGLLVSAIS